MIENATQLKQWIHSIANLLEDDEDLDAQQINVFLHEPELALSIIDLIEDIDEKEIESKRSYYSACIFGLDICVAQFQSAFENGNKLAGKTLEQLMHRIALAIKKLQHSLSFWLPILNAFYDVHAELSDELRDAYLDLATQEEHEQPLSDIDHLQAIQAMIEELSDLSIFDITENFFAQSYAMPLDFFAELVFDLYNIRQGQDIALLLLLHPKMNIREMVLAAHEEIIDEVEFTPESLSRLQAIQNWYPSQYHDQISRWIKIQRKKGVVFRTSNPGKIINIKASEVDGSGAQGIFIHLRFGRINQLCGILLKYNTGIKDVWMTPHMTSKDIQRYYREAFDDSVTLRAVNEEYLFLIIEHFLAITLDQHEIPDLHFLELQELLGLHFHARPIDASAMIDQLGIHITPFTPELVRLSFKRSKNWLNNKDFTESWFIENPHIDKLVNRCSSITDGIKVCDIEQATDLVFTQVFEAQRNKWLFHFLWTSLWLKAQPSGKNRNWQDSYMIAHAIAEGIKLEDIPVMKEIVKHTIYNSIETMNERRTHLA